MIRKCLSDYQNENLNHLKGCDYYSLKGCTCGYWNMMRELRRLERDIEEYKEPHEKYK